MRIVFVENIDPFRENTSGIATYLKRLVSYLKMKDIHTTLVGSGTPPSGSDPASMKIPVDRYIRVTAERRGHPRYIAGLLRCVRSIDLEPDAILHGQRPDVLFPFILAGKNQKMVCSLHGAHCKVVYRKKGKFKGWVYERLEALAIRHSQLLVPVDDGTREYYIQRYPHCKDKIVTIPIGVNFKDFHPMDKDVARRSFGFNPGEKIILYAGRLEMEKNVRLIINAFRRVKEKVPGVKLVVAGSGRREEYLHTYVRNPEITGVVFLGTIDHLAMPRLLNCADVFALPSTHEGSPTVVKEALACNIPVVSTDVGDVKSVIYSLEGCCIARPETDDFARCLLETLNRKTTPDYRPHLSAFSNDTLFNRTVELYRQLISEE